MTTTTAPGADTIDPKVLKTAGTDAGFGHAAVVIPLAIGVVLTAAFAMYAVRVRQPLVNVRLLAHRSVGSASAVLFFSGFSLYGAMLLLPLHYQEFRGLTPLAAGIRLIPQGVGSLFSRPLAGTLTDKIGGRPIAVAGFVIVAASAQGEGEAPRDAVPQPAR
jgi:nitrate/nitrite transporter NarK